MKNHFFLFLFGFLTAIRATNENFMLPTKIHPHVFDAVKKHILQFCEQDWLEKNKQIVLARDTYLFSFCKEGKNKPNSSNLTYKKKEDNVVEIILSYTIEFIYRSVYEGRSKRYSSSLEEKKAFPGRWYEKTSRLNLLTGDRYGPPEKTPKITGWTSYNWRGYRYDIFGKDQKGYNRSGFDTQGGTQHGVTYLCFSTNRAIPICWCVSHAANRGD